MLTKRIEQCMKDHIKTRIYVKYKYTFEYQAITPVFILSYDKLILRNDTHTHTHIFVLHLEDTTYDSFKLII